ncbi:type IX secretion system PorP/SprF family membrane protein [Pedobacter sp. UYP30]|uniref:PorP/SprF family type IX secretion system membrane protein n=1 Tax=Pedobacter sp. UYP30 TaxID=1756400 RepID=UPI003392B42E
MKKKTLPIVFLILSSLFCSAQDQIYSQFYNAPLYLNPALTGQFEGSIRFNALYRNQWTGLASDYSYLHASGDLNFPEIRSGFGLMFNRSSEGTAYLVKNNIAASYAYIIPGDNFTLSFGLQGGITNLKLDWSKLVFGDQIDVNTGYNPGLISGAERPNVDSRFYFDAAAGANLVYGKAMLGLAAHHINHPDESLTGINTKLPIRLSANLGYQIALIPDQYNRDGTYVIPSVVVYKQENITSFSVGAQFKYKGVNVGAWFRKNGLSNGSDAVVFSAIFDIFSKNKNGEKFRVGISHDATTSKLNYANTGGTTELGVSYQKYFPGSGNYGEYNGLRCYDFY